MRFSTLIIIGMLAAVAYRWQIAPRSNEATAATPGEAETQKANSPDEAQRSAVPALTSAVSKEQDRAAVMEAARSAPRGKMITSVLQHLSDGRLLTNGVVFLDGLPRYTTNYALSNYPGEVPDGKEIECQVVYVGLYEYTDVSGARRTIYEVMCPPADEPVKRVYSWDAAAPQQRVIPKATPTPEDILRKYGTQPPQ